MNKRFALFAVLLFAFSLASPTGAVAKEEEQRAFEFHVGDAFLQGFGLPPDDSAQTAPVGGDTITLIATGRLRVNGRKAEGTGSFNHMRGTATLAVGSFTADRLQSFRDFGTQSDVPSTFHGGTAKILVHVVAHPAPAFTGTVKFDALLTIDCALGTVPAGVTEGFSFMILNGPNHGLTFDKKRTGFTVFVAENEREEEKD